MSRNFELLTSLGEPVMGREPRSREDEPVEHRPEPAELPPPRASDEEIGLVQQLFLLPGVQGPKAVVFCGVEAEQSAGAECIRVSEILAAGLERQVCLVDADVRVPSLHLRYSLRNEPGITDAVLHPGPVRSFAQRIGESHLWLLSAGSRGAGRHLIWPIAQLQDRVADLKTEFDFVVINAPAVGENADAIALGQAADGVVLLLRAGFTRKRAVLKAKEKLAAAKVSVVGVVLTGHAATAQGARRKPQ